MMLVSSVEDPALPVSSGPKDVEALKEGVTYSLLEDVVTIPALSSKDEVEFTSPDVAVGSEVPGPLVSGMSLASSEVADMVPLAALDIADPLRVVSEVSDALWVG